MNMRVERTNYMRLFERLEREVYANDPLHIPTALRLPKEGQGYVVYEDDLPVACCHAQLQTANPSIGTIGSFYALNNLQAAQTILTAAVQWLKEKDAQRILAPMDGDTWHPYRVNTGPYNEPPFVKEPWNPPYYSALMEASGFTVTETYESYTVDSSKAAANQKKFYDRCIRQGYTFSSITSTNFAKMLLVIYRLSLDIFSENILYTPISEDEFIRMYLPAKSLAQNGLLWLARDPAGSPAGYAFTFPDYADAIRAMNRKNNLSAKIRFLLNRHKAKRTCLKTLGTIPDKRGSGLTAALTYLSYKNSADLGYPETLMCLMHSSNDSRRFGGGANRPFRTYALYEFSK